MKWWNNPLINMIFLEEEAQIICQIPLSLGPTSDILTWRGTSNGEFSVHSAYHREKESQCRRRGECSGQCARNIVWKKIWSLEIPNAVKMFMWKACNDFLPTKLNLLRRGVVNNDRCSICERGAESMKHCLWSCPAA